MRVNHYTEQELIWQGIRIKVRHCPNWLCDDTSIQHVELYSEYRARLPVTETGYRSHFLCGSGALADFDGDPVVYVKAWLDHASKKQNWRAERQLELF